MRFATMIVSLYISLFSSVSICFMYFEALLLNLVQVINNYFVIIFQHIIMLSLCIDPFIIMKYSFNSGNNLWLEVYFVRD